MDSFILGGGEMEYWDAYNEQRERQGKFLKRGQPIAEGHSITFVSMSSFAI